MKVKDLMKQLSELDPEARVVSFGVEAGYRDITKLLPVEVAIDFYKEGPWMGPHEFKCFLTDSHTGKFENVITLGYN
jgi:hypothetical protein